MAAPSFEEVLKLVAEFEAINAKQTEGLRIMMLAATYCLASGEMAPTDPEFKAMAARSEGAGLAILRGTDASVEAFWPEVAEYAGRPGAGERVAEALRRQAAAAAALRARAEELVAFMRDMASLAPDDSALEASSREAAAGQPAAARSRRPNAKYFGPEWSN